MQSPYAKLLHAMLVASLILLGIAGARAQFANSQPVERDDPFKGFDPFACPDPAPGMAPLEKALQFYNCNDYGKALVLLRPLAEQGLAAAQYWLGLMYAQGKGIPQNYLNAHMWLNLSAAQGDYDAAQMRDYVAKLMTPAQVAEAQKLARDWKPKKGWWHWF